MHLQSPRCFQLRIFEPPHLGNSPDDSRLSFERNKAIPELLRAQFLSRAAAPVDGRKLPSFSPMLAFAPCEPCGHGRCAIQYGHLINTQRRHTHAHTWRIGPGPNSGWKQKEEVEKAAKRAKKNVVPSKKNIHTYVFTFSLTHSCFPKSLRGAHTFFIHGCVFGWL